ncbi:NADP-dependent oxidoreductase [Gynuella sp.]|uniref:NADP-dependent oxidoreductase n=1 Tax=Gynuella sp. TaxID=2969146 RepID=UPI003D0F174C
MQQYKAIHLISRPDTTIQSDNFEIRQHSREPLKAGEFRVKQTCLSLDPAMRGWMSPDTNSYIPPVELGAIMRSNGLGEVIESQHDKFAVGTRVMGMFGWTEEAVSNGQGVNAVSLDLPDEAILSTIALPGLTAAQGFLRLSDFKAGETILISGGAGSVGSIVGQMAKAEGLRVIGISGSEEKCRWMTEELGFDVALNYRSDNLKDEVRAAAPDGIDIYFENTGGPIQSIALHSMNTFGRVIVCGLISQYNKAEPDPGPDWVPVIKQRLRIQGFTMPDHMHEAPELAQLVAGYLMKGQLKYRAHVLEGLESAVSGINLLFSGENQGKLVVKLS